MIKVIEVTYSNPWNLTFYYVAILAILIGLFWTYIQVFVKKDKKKKKNKLKENIIYQHDEDVIEKENNYKK